MRFEPFSFGAELTSVHTRRVRWGFPGRDSSSGHASRIREYRGVCCVKLESMPRAWRVKLGFHWSRRNALVFSQGRRRGLPARGTPLTILPMACYQRPFEYGHEHGQQYTTAWVASVP